MYRYRPSSTITRWIILTRRDFACKQKLMEVIIITTTTRLTIYFYFVARKTDPGDVQTEKWRRRTDRPTGKGEVGQGPQPGGPDGTRRRVHVGGRRIRPRRSRCQNGCGASGRVVLHFGCLCVGIRRWDEEKINVKKKNLSSYRRLLFPVCVWNRPVFKYRTLNSTVKTS